MLKRTLSVALTLTVLMSLLVFTPLNAAAQTDASGDFSYEVLDDGTAEITKYTGSSAELDIPSELDGYTVTSIGHSAFYGCTTLKDITIPGSVKVIGMYAFYDCARLRTVVMEEGVEQIADDAFAACGNLRTVTIPKSVIDISDWAFSEIMDYFEYIIGYANSYAHQYAYKKGFQFMPLGLEKIEPFSYPTTFVTSSLARTAFIRTTLQESTVLKVYCADGESYLYDRIWIDLEFYDGICDFKINDDDKIVKGRNTVYVTYFGFTTSFIIEVEVADDYQYQTYAYDSDSIEITKYSGSASELVIPSQIDGKTVKAISQSAFKGCSNLTHITISTGVTYISYYAFSNCTSLESIDIPDSVTSIRSSAFDGCESLKTINVDENNLNYASVDGVLYNKDISELIICPRGKSEIIFPDSVRTIGSEAFSTCRLLQNITIPDSITIIGYATFEKCSSLQKIIIPDSVTYIGTSAFESCIALQNINIPDSVAYLGAYTFAFCTSLRNITIPNSVTSIEEGTFYYCPSLESMTIPDSVTTIGDYAFCDCQDLTYVYYSGSEQEWADINIGDSNDCLTGAKIYFNCALLSDIESGISVIGVLDNAKLGVEEITDSESVGNIVLKDGEELVAAYDISLLKDGAAIQPDGEVTVKIPTETENMKVYRVESDNSLTDMNAVYEDGCMVFTTDHFSVYILAAVREESTEPATNPTEAETNPTEPETEPTESTTPTAPTFPLGDVNLSGKVDITDATCIQRHLAMLMVLPDEGIALGDTNGNGHLDIVDATVIQRYLAGFDTPMGKMD